MEHCPLGRELICAACGKRIGKAGGTSDGVPLSRLVLFKEDVCAARWEENPVERPGTKGWREIGQYAFKAELAARFVVLVRNRQTGLDRYHRCCRRPTVLQNAGRSEQEQSVLHLPGVSFDNPSKWRAHGITKVDLQAERSGNLIHQDFRAEKPNKKLLTDIAEIPCQDGKLYLAAVLNCLGGSIQGFQTDEHIRAELCMKALEKMPGTGDMIVHSDPGSQFISLPFWAALKRYKAIQSMSGTGVLQ